MSTILKASMRKSGGQGCRESPTRERETHGIATLLAPTTAKHFAFVVSVEQIPNPLLKLEIAKSVNHTLSNQCTNSPCAPGLSLSVGVASRVCRRWIPTNQRPARYAPTHPPPPPPRKSQTI